MHGGGGGGGGGEVDSLATFSHFMATCDKCNESSCPSSICDKKTRPVRIK